MKETPPFSLIEFLDRDKSLPFLDEYEPRIWDEEEMYERIQTRLRNQEESQRGKPEVQVNRIETEENGFRIVAEYDQDFIEALKAIVPYRERIWENSTKTWWVSNLDYLPEVEAIFNMAYSWTFEDWEVPE